jgi:hypothetical protein
VIDASRHRFQEGAVQALAARQLAAEHKYVMALHTHQANPHVHAGVNYLGRRDKIIVVDQIHVLVRAESDLGVRHVEARCKGRVSSLLPRRARSRIGIWALLQRPADGSRMS